MNKGFSPDSDAAAQNAFTVNDSTATTLPLEIVMRNINLLPTMALCVTLLAGGAVAPAFAQTAPSSSGAGNVSDNRHEGRQHNGDGTTRHSTNEPERRSDDHSESRNRDGDRYVRYQSQERHSMNELGRESEEHSETRHRDDASRRSER
jgi:hypothetical protein